MIPNELYDLALAFRKVKLWKKLYDTQLFAVKHSDGSIGYCCVMGEMGEHLALAVYPGDQGLASYREVWEDDAPSNPFAYRERQLCQDCVMVSYEYKNDLRPRALRELTQYLDAHHIALRGTMAFPMFQRFRPHYFPWYLDDAADQLHLKEALEAALALSQRLATTTPHALGFTDGEPYDRAIPLLEKQGGEFVWGQMALPKPKKVVYPSPAIKDDIALAKLAKSKKQGSEWACDVFMHVTAIRDDDEEEGLEEPRNAPFYPYALLIMNNTTDMILALEMAEDPQDYSEQFAKNILDVAIKCGKPKRILVVDERTHALFARLAEQMGAKLVKKERVASLEEAEQGLYDQSERGPEIDMDRLAALLDDQDTLREMPDEILMQFAMMIEQGLLPDAIAGKLVAEIKRRRL